MTRETDKMHRFKCRELRGPGRGETTYGVWDTWADELVEVHRQREAAEGRCEALKCDKNTGTALRWWTEAGIRLRKVMWETRLLWLLPEQREAVGEAHGIPLGMAMERLTGLLRDWCECMEALTCAIYHLHSTDAEKRPGHDLDQSWVRMTTALPPGDLEQIKSEYQAWQDAWNDEGSMNDGWARSEWTLEETFTRHKHSYNDMRYFPHDRKKMKRGDDDSVRIQLHASEMIAMLVLDQYLMDKLGCYVYRNGATVFEIPGLRIKVPQTDGRHRLNQATKRFKQQSTAVLHGLLCAAPIEGKLWAQVWDRHTPQDYWRYDSVSKAITGTDNHDEGTAGAKIATGAGSREETEATGIEKEMKHPEAPRRH